MEQAPTLIIVWNAGENNWESEAHSVAVAIQNMLLMAHSLGLGSLWIADVYYAPDAIISYLGKKWKLTAAVTLGWPAERERNKPVPRKMGIDEVSEFLS
jgi:nitroreductase